VGELFLCVLREAVAGMNVLDQQRAGVERKDHCGAESVTTRSEYMKYVVA